MALAPSLVLLFLAPLAFAGDLGRTDGLWREYLSETVRRGVPVLNTEASSVPYWPVLDRLRADAASLEPGADVDLISSWMDLQESDPAAAETTLKAGWPKPALTRLSPRQWGEALFAAWDPASDPGAWTQAWLAWDDKAYSPRALVRGLETFEKTDPSAVAPLLDQALRLYPEDRRFLGLVARHPDSATSAQGLIARDLAAGGWSQPALRSLLTRAPEVKDLLVKAGYPAAGLDDAVTGDYGVWLASASATAAPADGSWTWDADEDGRAESTLVVQGGHLATWTRKTPDGLWSLGFAKGKPDTVTEVRGGATWTLRYDDYPWARTLEYRWAETTIVYRFRPLAQAVPLWPAERFTAPVERLPAVLASLWLPLDPRALAQQAASVETWQGGVKTRTVYLFKGEVWLSVEDTRRSGHNDTWSYFRSGHLVSVYRDPEGGGRATLRELYSRGELTQVQSRPTPGAGPEFVLFPAEGVQLWDPRGTGRPLERLFVWTGQDKLNALVFSGSSLPWETMPPWEPRP